VTKKRFGLAAGLILCGVACCMLCANAQSTPSTKTTPPSESVSTSSQETQSTESPQLTHRNPRYELSRDDVFEIKFPLTPEFDQTATVQPDGYITLVGVGELHVLGETVPQLTQSIRTAYANILHDPIISIRLDDFQKPYFIVGGWVGHPGKYDLRGQTTVIQGLEIAGGFTESSKHSEVWLFRRVSDQWVESEKINVKDMLKKGNLQEDVMLHPGDMIYVPQNRLSKVSRFIPVASMGTYLTPAP
jgi:polysaccharide biosynthesis/export protein